MPSPPPPWAFCMLPPSPSAPETGLDLSFLSDKLEEVVVEALQDAKVQKELKATVVGLLDDPQVQKSMRPHLIEAAVLLGLAITGGMVIGRAITRRM